MDHLLDAAKSVVPKVATGDMQAVVKRIDDVVMGSWDSQRAKLYIAATMMEYEYQAKVLNVKVKLLEALLNGPNQSK